MSEVVSTEFPKRLMEKSGLLRYAATEGRTHIQIEYDANLEEGWMRVCATDPAFASEQKNDIH